MTEKQAIEIIKKENQWESNARIREAFEMAIKALEEIRVYRVAASTPEELVEFLAKCRAELKEIEKYRAIGTVEECKEAVLNIEHYYVLGKNEAIDEAIEASAKAICVGCGYLDGHKCTYKGANCSVSKPMLEVVVNALEQMKAGE